MRRALPLVLVVLALIGSGMPTGASAPTPGVGCRPSEAGAPLPRIVPEPEVALDYISFDEWRACLTLLERAAPQYLTIKELAKSPGWTPAGGGAKLQSPVYWIEVTNEASPVPFEHRLKTLFVLSIHGNEKGGREGGFRVIEDLARGIGIAQEYPELRKYLDYQVAVFVFANPDGWTHEELSVFIGSPTGGFTRENANRVDLNRQWPNHGWSDTGRRAMSQPEIVSVAKAIKNYTNWVGGTDIHGMLTPSDANMDDFNAAIEERRAPRPGGSLLMGMLSAGQSDPLKMLKTTRLAELLKERVDKDANLREWSAAPNLGAWGGEVMHWGTSWDTIGYVDSGFTGDFIFQPHGMNAVDIDFEMSYNHIVTDNHYAGAGMELNRLHVRLVRQTVGAFLDAAAADVHTSYETKGLRTGYLHSPKIVTNKDGGPNDVLTGWASENPDDDLFDYAHVDYQVSSNDYFTEVAPFVRDGDKPGVLESVPVADVTPERLAAFDTFVVAGSAIEQLRADNGALGDLRGWVQKGGNLVLTDEALQLLGTWTVVPATAIKNQNAYAGYSNFQDPASPLLKGLRGLARQTYEALPIGYARGAAPNWYVEPAAWGAAGGTVAGQITVGGAMGVNLGEVKMGDGKIRILGSLLPDPTEDNYHPYGLDAYATTYTGNLVFRNMVGWDEVFGAAPIVVENIGKSSALGKETAGSDKSLHEDKRSTPGLAFVMGAFLLAAVAILRRRVE